MALLTVDSAALRCVPDEIRPRCIVQAAIFTPDRRRAVTKQHLDGTIPSPSYELEGQSRHTERSTYTVSILQTARRPAAAAKGAAVVRPSRDIVVGNTTRPPVQEFRLGSIAKAAKSALSHRLTVFLR